jgi:hypothetical protein
MTTEILDVSRWEGNRLLLSKSNSISSKTGDGYWDAFRCKDMLIVTLCGWVQRVIRGGMMIVRRMACSRFLVVYAMVSRWLMDRDLKTAGDTSEI